MGPMRVVAIASAAVLLGNATAVSSPAAAAPIPMILGAGAARTPRLAVDSQGRAVAVWSSERDAAPPIVQARVRPSAAAAWGPVERLGRGDYPSVAGDGRGDFVAVWGDASSDGAVGSAIYRDGNWEALPLKSTEVLAESPTVALNGRGDAISAWSRWSKALSSDKSVQAAGLAPGAAEWLSMSEVSPSGVEDFAPSVAIDPAGEATISWQRWTRDPTTSRVISASRAADGDWGIPVVLSPPGSFTGDVAIDAAGRATTVWWRQLGRGRATVEAASSAVSGGDWSRPVRVSGSRHGASGPHVVVDGEGSSLVVWESFDGHTDVIETSEHSLGGRWTTPQVISCARRASGLPQVAIDARGDAIVVWQAKTARHEQIQAVTRRGRAGRWSLPFAVSRSSSEAIEPEVGIGEHGTALVVWNAPVWIRSEIQSSVQAASVGPTPPADSACRTLG
jgi:hypothetical protein